MDFFGNGFDDDPLDAAEEVLANLLPQGVMQHVMDFVQQCGARPADALRTRNYLPFHACWL